MPSKPASITPWAARLIELLPVAFALSLAIPVFLPIPGFEQVPPFAIGAALISIPVLFARLGVDVVSSGGDGRLRLVLLFMLATAAASWIAGIIQFGLSSGSMLSFLNWVALIAIVVVGQMVLTTTQRLSWILNAWVAAYTIVSLMVLAYLVLTFGADIFTSTYRVPFQRAIRGFFPSWPNYFGLALVVALCIAYARLVAGSGTLLLKIQIGILLAALTLTFSRGAYVAFLLAVLVMTAVADRKRRTPIFVGIFLALAALVAFVPAVGYQFVASFDLTVSQGLSIIERLAFARQGIVLWLENPIFGIGFLQFASFVDVGSVYAALNQPASPLGSVHNEYVTMLVKAGTVGALGFIAFSVAAFSIIRRALRHPEPSVRSCAMAGLGIAVALYSAGFVQESIRSIGVSAMFWVLIGALDVIGRRSAGRRAPESSHSSPAG